MGWYCYTVISCGVNEKEVAERVAKKHLERQDLHHIVNGFLNHVAEGKAYACSHKGSTITYGAVGNGVMIDTVAEELLPFFDDLWDEGDGGLFDFDHAVIMVNQEQSCKTDIYEIVSKSHTDERECTHGVNFSGQRVRKYEGNWSWHQM